MNPKIEELQKAVDSAEDGLREASAVFITKEDAKWYEDCIAGAKYNLAIGKLRAAREGLEIASRADTAQELIDFATALIADIWGEESEAGQ